MKMLKRVLYIFAALSLICLVSFGAIQLRVNAPLSRYTPEINHMPRCDAVLVLGARVYEDGTPSPVLRDRLDYAYTAYKAGKAGKILASGDHGTRGYDEVAGMLQYLLKLGVPSEDIFLDHAGFDTYDSVYRAKEVFKVDSMIISTQSFHMYRALYLARGLGIDAYGLESPDRDIYNMSYLNFREAFAKVKGFLDLEVLHSKPRYLGGTIPISGDGTITQN